MPTLKNASYIIQGEISLVVTAMRRSQRWTSHSHQDEDQDPLLGGFSRLKEELNHITDLGELEPNVYLGPFLEVIRSEDTTGPITGLALTSVNKFLSYGLIEPNNELSATAIENIADAVTHARFVGTDPGSDEVVLMKILHVLRTLLLTPAGTQLTNESVCEIMQSCFRICFEMRLSELLRKSAEHTLMDMVQLLFSRLPGFMEDAKWMIGMKKLKMRAGTGMDRHKKHKKSPKGKRKKVPLQPQPNHSTSASQQHAQKAHFEQQRGVAETSPVEQPTEQSPSVQMEKEILSEEPSNTPEDAPVPSTEIEGTHGLTAEEEEAIFAPETLATTPKEGGTTMVDIHEGFREASEKEQAESTVTPDVAINIEEDGDGQTPAQHALQHGSSETDLSTRKGSIVDVGEDHDSLHSDTASLQESDYVNPRGVRFTPQSHSREGAGPLIPYGLPCVRELFRFLISLINPLDRHNTDVMIHMGLSLLTVAFEAGADHIAVKNSLLMLVKDELCRNLFSLLQLERLSLFAASLRVCFLLFESMRGQLKFQLEMYLTKLMDIIISESPRISYEQREIAVESVVHLWRIPGLVTELYLNYDCDLFCSNLFDDLTKLLSKNAFPVQGLFNTNILSLDALLTVIDSIEQHCHSRILQGDAGKTFDGDVTDLSKSVPPLPPTLNADVTKKTAQNETDDAKSRRPYIRPNRMKISARIPTVEELNEIKVKKKLLLAGADQFNQKPSKGIAFLQEQGLLATPLDPEEVAHFLRENPKLDKKQIGEYVSAKKNAAILEAYVESFHFEDIRVDEALRQYLEAFRLPGEAPVIQHLLEHFAEHWHKSNGEPFADADAAFTLAYAVIMLNTDQHNHNVKKQNIPMTVKDFKRNVSKTNGGEDFDQDMLEKIFITIKEEEIVMPEEQTGLIKENYMWKVLLKRGSAKEGQFLHAPTGSFDNDLFTIIWGPTVAALSFVFDKSVEDTIIQRAIAGFRKCAMISAHYGMSDVFDNLVISLCKFTTLLNAVESAESIPITFGNNTKAQLAARTVFGLAHRHGDILREGWKNIVDCMLQLFRANLLPSVFIEVEDFLDPSGRISLIREEIKDQRSESGVLSSLYSYFAASEQSNQKAPSPEEEQATKTAQTCILECHTEQLISDCKFLRMDSLQELIKALIFASQHQEHNDSLEHTCDQEDFQVFYLELLIKVVLQNRDRVGPIWQSVRDNFFSFIVNSTEHTFLVERAVIGLIRIAFRLLRREEIAVQVLTSLRMLLMMKPAVIHSLSRQLAYGLHDLLRTNAANIHCADDWYTLFTLLEVVGAGAMPPAVTESGTSITDNSSDTGAQSDSELSSHFSSEVISDRGYTSDSELYGTTQKHTSDMDIHVKPVPNHGSWLLVDKDLSSRQGEPVNQFSIDLHNKLQPHDSKSLMKASESLAFLVRDAAHITPHNFESCVHAIRTFVEASVDGGQHLISNKSNLSVSHQKENKKRKHKKGDNNMTRSTSSPSRMCKLGEEESDENTAGAYHSLSIQLLDLMHTLHTRAASIFSSWAEERTDGEEGIDAGSSTLWIKCWCPLLQGIARLCCDSRRQVRSQALTYLQRALLVHDLKTLSAVEWESCFNKVLFPLLTKLLENNIAQDPVGMEETRMRASTLLCRVFLQHLGPLLSLTTFTALWLTILEFMDKYMHADQSDLLYEAIPESLKNMLLVMDTAGIFKETEEGESKLWPLTWDKIDTFLPNLRSELFKTPETAVSQPEEPPVAEAPPPEPHPAAAPPTVPETQHPEPQYTEQNNTQAPPPEPPRSTSPLNVEPLPASTYFQLHPPLPHVSSPPKPIENIHRTAADSVHQQTVIQGVPLLLNPDIMHTAGFPLISTQGTPAKTTIPNQGQNNIQDY